MLSKAKSKFIKSLQLKKYRIAEQCFVVDGGKSVKELLGASFTVLTLVATKGFIEANRHLLRDGVEVVEATEKELSAIGSFQTNESALAVAQMRKNTAPSLKPGEWALVLDDIRDPGNLGTIIRTADWYGVKNIIASHETADFYNPKVISASMGSFTRVSVYYTELVEYLAGCSQTIYGAFLDGEDVHTARMDKGGLLVIGNEASGISEKVGTRVTQRVTIPCYGKAESLNAAIATAVILDNVMRSKK